VTTVADADLKELKDLITNGFTKLEVNQARIEERLNRIDKYLELVETRINTQTNWFVGAFAALVGGLLALLGNLFFFPMLNELTPLKLCLTGWIIGILFALVYGLLGLLGKVTFFPNP
jgi:hypothetical protein